jgi:hypothetical protein
MADNLFDALKSGMASYTAAKTGQKQPAATEGQTDPQSGGGLMDTMSKFFPQSGGMGAASSGAAAPISGAAAAGGAEGIAAAAPAALAAFSDKNMKENIKTSGGK